MGGNAFSHLINVEVGTSNSEVICIGVGEKVVGLRECGDKEFKLGRAYASALKDPYSIMKRGRDGKVVSAVGCTPFGVGRYSQRLVLFL